MDTRAFKKIISLIAGKVAEKMKNGLKEVAKTCNTGIALVAAKPSNPGANATSKELIMFNYKHSKYLQDTDQWEENNSKLYICFMQYCSPQWRPSYRA